MVQKIFYSGCKNPDDQTKLGWPKTLCSEAVLQAKFGEYTSESSTRRLSGKLAL